VVLATLLGGGREPRIGSGWADRRAARASAWLRFLGGAAALGIAVNCSQVAATPAEPRSGAHCADRVADGLTHVKPTSGAWLCLNVDLQNRMHAFAVDGDGGLALIAFREHRLSSTFMDRLPDGGYLYWVHGEQRESVLMVWLDRDGKVCAFNSAEHPDYAEQGPVRSQPFGR
jgi:hypothetical protein